jgi:hypothetical protein
MTSETQCPIYWNSKENPNASLNTQVWEIVGNIWESPSGVTHEKEPVASTC